MLGIILGEKYIQNCVSNPHIRYEHIVRRILYAVLSIGILACAYGENYAAGLIIYYSLWLMQLAYVDYYTGYVYDCMVYSGIIPAVICLAYLCIFNWNIIGRIMLSILIVIIMLVIAGHTQCIGDGDEEVMVVGTVFYTLWLVSGGHTDILDIILLNSVMFYIGILLFIIRRCTKIIWKKRKLDKAYPFLPSLFMSLVIMVCAPR